MDKEDLSFKVGDMVRYRPTNDIGRIKSFSNGQYAFVVYHCNNEWDKYQDYTAARTRIDDLDKINKGELK